MLSIQLLHSCITAQDTAFLSYSKESDGVHRLSRAFSALGQGNTIDSEGVLNIAASTQLVQRLDVMIEAHSSDNCWCQDQRDNSIL